MENPRLCIVINRITRILDEIQNPAVSSYHYAKSKIKLRTISEKHTVNELENLREKVNEAQKMIDGIKDKEIFQSRLDKLEEIRRQLLTIFQTEQDDDPPPVPKGTIVIAY